MFPIAIFARIPENIPWIKRRPAFSPGRFYRKPRVCGLTSSRWIKKANATPPSVQVRFTNWPDLKAHVDGWIGGRFPGRLRGAGGDPIHPGGALTAGLYRVRVDPYSLSGPEREPILK